MGGEGDILLKLGAMKSGGMGFGSRGSVGTKMSLAAARVMTPFSGK
jgi:hypothetical protein